MKIHTGDALKILQGMPDESIDCVITSPPYYALRDYGTEGQIGLEPTHWDYLVHLSMIFDECKRVLKKTGTCWVNLGDTYGGSGNGYGDKKSDPKFGAGRSRTIKPTNTRNAGAGSVSRHNEGKSLLQIPARFAIQMTDRGWILRNKLIWHKPNAMPQSVKDRFTVDYEELLFFTKSKKYYFEQQLEPLDDRTLPRYNRGSSTDTKMAGGGKSMQGHKGYFKADGSPLFNPKGRNKRSVWSISTQSYGGAHFAVFPEALVRTPILAGCPRGGVVLDPFMGSGTTLAVAAQEGREGIGIELNAEYVELARERLAKAQVRLPLGDTLHHGVE